MGRNPTSERKLRGKSTPNALVLPSGARDAGPNAESATPSFDRRAVAGAAAPATDSRGVRALPVGAPGALVTRSTLDVYHAMVVPFLTWLDGEGVERFEHMGVEHARVYRARLASTPGRHGRPLQPDTLHGSHRAIGTFLRWAFREGYGIDGRLLDLPAPRIPEKTRPSVTSRRFARCWRPATPRSRQRT